MKKVCLALALLAGSLAAWSVAGEGGPKSGPQVGQDVPGPFHPLNVTGPNAGKKHCLYCENGGNPVAVVFARHVSKPVTTLIKKIDEATEKNRTADMGSFVVFLSLDENLGKQLESVAKEQNLKHTILSIEHPAGPEEYNVAKDAEVTVLLYNEFTVRANHAFRKGQLNDKAIAEIVADVSKIVPQK